MFRGAVARSPLDRTTEMYHESRQLLRLAQNSARRLKRPISQSAPGIFLQMIIQSMDKSQSTKLRSSRGYKAQARTNTDTGFIVPQEISRKLPKEGAHEIVQKLILTVFAAKYARPSDRLMHSSSGSPSADNGFQPTDFQKSIDFIKAAKQILEPINTHGNVTGCFRTKSDYRLASNS